MIEFRKEYFADERDDTLNEIGKPTQRQDMLGHVTGRSPFFDDHLFDGLLHLKCLRSPHHHARIRSVDTSEAERMPGVRRIIRARDVPHNLNTLLSLMGFGLDDEPMLADKKVAYVGEPVVAVVAESERQAYDAIAKIRVDYDVLPHVLDVEEALKPGAPSVNPTYPTNTFTYHEKYDHQKLRFGDVEAALRQADHVVEGRYQMSPIEQAPTETCGAIAAPETNNRYVVYTSTQALFFSLGTAAKILKLSSNRMHFIGGTVGGGFGGKVDSIHEPMAILGCMLTGRPVKFIWNREEEMQVGAPRGAERWYITDGVMNDGRIVARKFTGYFDSGAYTRLSSYAIIKSVGHLPGPYTIPNVSADVYCVFTNRTPATAMRGFGITGVDFAIETHMDKVAHRVKMNPIELRLKNAYLDGDMKAHRRLAKNTALVECCQVVAEKAKWSIGPEYRAMSSLKGGGGERAAIPHTIIDNRGLARPASGLGSYQPPPAPGYTPTPAYTPPSYSPEPQPVRPYEPAQAAPPPAAPSPTTPRPAGNRFSSISGLRRR
ncbi:xanthine dehydrogenase family protein molybdopterin-binding subunit [Shinella zoogloeoides]|uniref:xanthine dehydrogenase family protein molybdopterin-binding subunit n=1 Tax=Shinella zoogloeoides TaxID=352475 RepID=UPI000E646CF6|nr:molybdopterin cofactor-binding domain-containing protein [Shinella zoogloeoides]